MDQIITIAIILLLLAIIIGSLRRGLQSLISFALLGLLVTLLIARLPGRGMSFAFGIFGGNDSASETSVAAIKAFDQFSQATSSFVPDLISSGLGTNSGSFPSETTDVTPTSPSTGNSNSSGNTSPGNTSPGNTNMGNTNTGSSTSGTGSNNTGTGSGNSGAASSGDSESSGSVRAWW
ncbi:MAG: hypothetical protein WBA57_24930 [Elainellaceae cyanobacterium]